MGIDIIRELNASDFGLKRVFWCALSCSRCNTFSFWRYGVKNTARGILMRALTELSILEKQ